ncbi:MAG: ammonium transporter [Kofleriaceae bacterium]|nr:ammonium transporter [Kofleriaceae bacterium]
MPKRAALGLLLALVGLGVVSAAAPNDLLKTGPFDRGDAAWMLTATALVMLMTPGLAFFYGGMVRGKNVISTLLQSFIALAVVSLVWVVVGFSLVFGDSIGGFIGDPRTFFMLRDVTSEVHPTLSPTIPLSLFVLFQLKFAIITPALITGAFAERVRFSAYVLFMVLFTIFIYAPLAHATWHPNGFLRAWGVLDFAGGTVVHVSAGVAALAGARFLGRRHDHAQPHAPANIPFVVLGTGMLWFGWFGFNAGSALAADATAISAFVATNTASATAAIAWLLCDAITGKRPSALGACIGAVVGLVAITPAAGFVGLGSSIAIGAVAAIISSVAVHLRSKTSIDDTLDVFPCHGVGGLTGMVCTAVFAIQGGLIHGGTKLFLVHLAAIALVVPAIYLLSAVLYRAVNAVISLRVSEDEERIGLDRSQHAETIYPAAPELVRAA